MSAVDISMDDAGFNSPPAKMMRNPQGNAQIPQNVQPGQATSVSFDPAAMAAQKKKDALAAAIPDPSKVTSASFGALETGKTPKKVKKALDTGVAPLEIKERWENCTGIPLRVVKFDKSGKRVTHACAMCKKKTSWYCMGCKSWFCITSRTDNEKREKTFVCQNIKGEGMIFEMTCYHQKHQAAWEREEGKERLEVTVKKLGDCATELENLKETYNLDL